VRIPSMGFSSGVGLWREGHFSSQFAAPSLSSSCVQLLSVQMGTINSYGLGVRLLLLSQKQAVPSRTRVAFPMADQQRPASSLWRQNCDDEFPSIDQTYACAVGLVIDKR